MSQSMSDDDDELDPDHLIYPYWALAQPDDWLESSSKPRQLGPEPSYNNQWDLWQAVRKLRTLGASLTTSPESPRRFAWNSTEQKCQHVDERETQLYRMCEDLSRKVEWAVWFVDKTATLDKTAKDDPDVAGILSVDLGLAEERAQHICDNTATLGDKGAWVHRKTAEIVQEARTIRHHLEAHYDLTITYREVFHEVVDSLEMTKLDIKQGIIETCNYLTDMATSVKPKAKVALPEQLLERLEQYLDLAAGQKEFYHERTGAQVLSQTIEALHAASGTSKGQDGGKVKTNVRGAAKDYPVSTIDQDTAQELRRLASGLVPQLETVRSLQGRIKRDLRLICADFDGDEDDDEQKGDVGERSASPQQ